MKVDAIDRAHTTLAYKVLTSDNYSLLMPTFSKYRVHYTPGEVIKAPANTLGLMCFSSMYHALWFVYSRPGILCLKQLNYWRVLLLGETHCPCAVAYFKMFEPLNYFDYDLDKWYATPVEKRQTTDAQPGVICSTALMLRDMIDLNGDADALEARRQLSWLFTYTPRVADQLSKDRYKKI